MIWSQFGQWKFRRQLLWVYFNLLCVMYIYVTISLESKWLKSIVGANFVEGRFQDPWSGTLILRAWGVRRLAWQRRYDFVIKSHVSRGTPLWFKISDADHPFFTWHPTSSPHHFPVGLMMKHPTYIYFFKILASSVPCLF